MSVGAPPGRLLVADATAESDLREPDLELDLHGVVIRIRADIPGLADGLRASWGAMATGRTGPRSLGGHERTIRVRAVDERIVLEDAEGTYSVAPGGLPLVALFDRVVHALNRGLDQVGILAIHAGAVEIDGRAVILAGPSGRGKSTLVVELVRQGAGLLSDECALVDRDDRTILPYPRAVHLRPATVRLVDELVVPDDLPRHEVGGGSDLAIPPDRLVELLGGWRSDGAPLGGVVLLDERLDPDANPRLQPVPAAVAVMELLRGTTSAAWDLGRARERLAEVIGAVSCVRLQAGDLGASAAAVTAWTRGLA